MRRKHNLSKLMPGWRQLSLTYGFTASDSVRLTLPDRLNVNSILPPAARLGLDPIRSKVQTKPSRPTTIRVLQLINGEHFAGAERVQDNLGLQLPVEGIETAFACVKPGRFDEMRGSRETPLYNLPMRNRLDVRPAFRLAKLIEREGFDLLHTHTPRTAMIGAFAARIAGVPFVHHVHGQTATEVNAGWKQRLVTRVENRSIRRAEFVIAVSHTAGEYLGQHGIPSERVVVVPNGIVGPAKFTTKLPPDQNQNWTLGIIGLLRPRKGLEVLLRSLASLIEQGHNVTLRAVGPFETDEYREAILQLTAELKLDQHVTWRGFQKDVTAELAAMDAFVFPSILPEGMPMVLLEAMAHGVPIVASRVPGVVDCVEDGRDAILVAPDQPAEMASGISRLMSNADLWTRLREQARARQQAEFSVAAMATRIAKIYRQVVA